MKLETDLRGQLRPVLVLHTSIRHSWLGGGIPILVRLTFFFFLCFAKIDQTTYISCCDSASISRLRV
jgi:hypothetical protein